MHLVSELAGPAAPPAAATASARPAGCLTRRKEARWALGVAEAENRMLVRYGEQTALLLPQSVTEAQALVSRILGPLIAHDTEHGTAYVDTLRAVLRHNRSWQLAAAELHIHKQTLGYRITEDRAAHRARADQHRASGRVVVRAPGARPAHRPESRLTRAAGRPGGHACRKGRSDVTSLGLERHVVRRRGLRPHRRPVPRGRHCAAHVRPAGGAGGHPGGDPGIAGRGKGGRRGPAEPLPGALVQRRRAHRPGGRAGARGAARPS